MDHRSGEGRDLINPGPVESLALCTGPSIQWTQNIKEHCLARFPVAVSGFGLCDWPVSTSNSPCNPHHHPPRSLPHLALPLTGLWSKKVMRDAVTMSKRPGLAWKAEGWVYG